MNDYEKIADDTVRFALARLTEECDQYELGAKNTMDIEFWRGYLDGVKALQKKIEDVKNAEH